MLSEKFHPFSDGYSMIPLRQYNKIPIFIVGKPGCSKSLSIQLINKSMKGEVSDKPLFQTLPKLILSSYQGSMASTSKGVENIFKRAKKTSIFR